MALPFFQVDWSLERAAVLLGAELALGCLLAWLIDPRRYGGALRGLCFLIFLAYAKHLADELADDRSTREAIFGFVLLGLPALAYAVLGSFAPAWTTLEPAEVDAAPEPREIEPSTTQSRS